MELFASNILKAGEAFLEGGEESPFIPSWHRVTSVYQNVFADLLDAVDADRTRSDAEVEAAARAMRTGATRYTAVRGTDALIDAIMGKFERDNGLSYEPAQVMADRHMGQGSQLL